MYRVEVREDGREPLPTVDVDGDFTIGPGADAKIRLPAGSPEVRVEHGHARWVARGPTPEARGPTPEVRGPLPIGEGVTLELGRYRVRIAPAPPGSVAAPPQRTESLARELLRGLMGTQGVPTLEIEDGPEKGSRTLAPPESKLVIGRGDEADWVILDGDLSKRHVELVRGWDGTRVRDLDSKNGTKVDGVRVTEAALRDGALIEIGNVRLRFRDPADRQLGAKEVAAPEPLPVPVRAEPRGGNPIAFYAALGICVVALAGLVWILGG